MLHTNGNTLGNERRSDENPLPGEAYWFGIGCLDCRDGFPMRPDFHTAMDGRETYAYRAGWRFAQTRPQSQRKG